MFTVTGHDTCFIILSLPPKAVPFQTRPVTSWNGRVDISCPAAATPMMVDTPQPLWQDSRAALYNTQTHSTLNTQTHSTLNKEYSLQHTHTVYRNQLSNTVYCRTRNIKFFFGGGGSCSFIKFVLRELIWLHKKQLK